MPGGEQAACVQRRARQAGTGHRITEVDSTLSEHAIHQRFEFVHIRRGSIVAVVQFACRSYRPLKVVREVGIGTACMRDANEARCRVAQRAGFVRLCSSLCILTESRVAAARCPARRQNRSKFVPSLTVCSLPYRRCAL